MSIEFKKAVRIACQDKISEDIYSITLEAEQIAQCAKPGQFVNLFCEDKSRLLPRPISICEINQENRTIRLVYRIAGKGTTELSKMQEGDTVTVMGPLGNGFFMENKKAFVIAGGIGIPPMLELSKQLDCQKSIILGYRDQCFLQEEFESHGQVHIATEDGSRGTKGNVMDVVKNMDDKPEIIYACGPAPMLKAVQEFGITQNIPVQLSLEEHMACGIGACLACVCQSKEKDHHSNVNNKRVCKDGPVFWGTEVEL